MTRTDIYNIPKRMRAAETCLKRSSVPECDKKLVIKFVDYLMFKQKISPLRIVKYIYTLKMISEHLDVSFRVVDKEDISQFLKWLHSSGYSDWTVRDYEIVLKRFYRWIGKPELIDDIQSSKPGSNLVFTDLIYEEDVLSMISNAQSEMIRAFVAVLFETGGRVGEIGGLNLKHVSFDSMGAVLHIDGKTGPRSPRIVWSAAYLEQWMNKRPECSHSALWISLEQKPLMYEALKKQFHTCARRAGIDKRIYHQLIRHSQASVLSGKLTDSMLKCYMGWSPGSNMPKYYVHLSGTAANDDVLRMYGLQSPAKADNVLWPRVCPACGKIHGPTHQLCIKCGVGVCDLPRTSDERVSNVIIPGIRILHK
jgi:site-specific recombinase XerD